MRSLPESDGPCADRNDRAGAAGAHRGPGSAGTGRPDRARAAAARTTRPRSPARLTPTPQPESKRHFRVTRHRTSPRFRSGAFMFNRFFLLLAAGVLGAAPAVAHQYELG